MTLHPQAQAVLDLLAAGGAVEPRDENVDEIRLGWGLLVTMGAGEVEAVAEVTDLEVPGPAGPVPIRSYLPAGADTEADGLPVVVFFRGGGWTIGSVADYDPIVRQIANRSGALVVSVDYRLAPEHPFPAALDDCWAATTWVAEHAAELGGDPTRIAVMGDSAGGNLAAVVAQRSARRGGPPLVAQVLVYPAVDAARDTESHRVNGEGYLLDRHNMGWFYDCYSRNGIRPDDPEVSPLLADDVSGVAPALVITAEYDPLRDEGEAYAAKLRSAGVATAATRYDGMIHGFFGLGAAFDAARDAMAEIGAALRSAFGTL
jgi:acetyl esterase